MVEQPISGLITGSLIFIIILLLAIIIVTIVFRKGQTCYANTFTAILIVMAYIMWACVYMAQMYPLVSPELTNEH